MKKRILDDPKHWYDRADEARCVADQIKDPNSRTMMVNIANGYERIAVRAQKRTEVQNLKFAVEVVGDDIIVYLPGTQCSITYERWSSGPRPLVEKKGWTRVDPNVAVPLEQFREAACQAALAKARELGWIASH